MKTQKLQYIIQTTLNMDEMDKLGFSMKPNSENGWIYHAQSSDKPLNIQMDSDNELDLDNVDNDEIVEAIAEKFYGCYGYEKLEFIAKLASEL